jgi:ribosomal protein S18 acetylase RimI-like enzyme
MLFKRERERNVRISFRKVEEKDRQFLFELRRRTMGEYIERTWGWDESWQQVDFHTRFNPTEQQVILADGEPVGFLHVERKPDRIYIADIQIEPEHQSRGIGARVIHGILAEGEKMGLPVTLQVLEVNQRAYRLYKALGFKEFEVESPYIKMRRGPGENGKRQGK